MSAIKIDMAENKRIFLQRIKKKRKKVNPINAFSP